MSLVIDRLAEMTALRDRDALDIMIVEALRDLLRLDMAAIHRVVGEAGDQRWLTRARLDANAAVATADANWVAFDDLPRLHDQPAWQQALSSSEPVVVMPTQAQAAVMTLFPLVGDQGAVGVAEVGSPQPLEEEQCRQVVGLLRVWRNVQSLLDYSERDSLTGLLNRKSFDESFYKASALPLTQAVRAQAAERRHEVGSQYWLGVVDIDHFKQVNDRFGHLIGDEVLLLLSRVMRASFRHHDLLYRFGGEEFVVLLRCDSQPHALAALERFAQAVRSYPFPQVGRITVSVGFTDVRAGDTPSAAVERADKAVYHAKHNGRDQIHHHGTLVAAGLLPDETSSNDLELF